MKRKVSKLFDPGQQPVKPKRGRPVTTGTTPAKDRKAKERANRATAGGERLNINLTPQGAADLAAIQADNPDLSKTEVVHAALYAYRLECGAGKG